MAYRQPFRAGYVRGSPKGPVRGVFGKVAMPIIGPDRGEGPGQGRVIPVAQQIAPKAG
jgi:hypothetical protein